MQTAPSLSVDEQDIVKDFEAVGFAAGPCAERIAADRAVE
jgi:hypothetical protein